MSVSSGFRPDAEECDRKVYLLRKDVRRFGAMFRRLQPKAKRALLTCTEDSRDDGNAWAIALGYVSSRYSMR